jgi:hypothetical protein
VEGVNAFGLKSHEGFLPGRYPALASAAQDIGLAGISQRV